VAGQFWLSAITFGLALALLGTPMLSAHALRLTGSTPAGHIRIGGTVVIDNAIGSKWTCGFNPYSGDGTNFDGFMYESLFFVNGLTGKSDTPWLATRWVWSNHNKTLTFTIRRNVRWSDGKLLTPADVVFTFDMLKKHSAIDPNSVWSVLSRVQRQGTDNVVFTFKRAAVPYQYYIGDQTWIVPQHIWSKVKDPTSFLDRKPVGTGALLVSRCAPRNITLVRNPHYWQTGKPYVSKVQIPAFLDNQSGNRYLVAGKANWGCQFMPSIKASYIAKDPESRHFWYPPGVDVYLYPNLKSYPLNITAVRRALSYGINRARINKVGEYGFDTPASQTGIVLPNFSRWYANKLDAGYAFYRYNPAKAVSLLKGAGFTRKGSGIFKDKHGKPLSLTVINNSGLTDFTASLQEMKRELRRIGVDLTADNMPASSFDPDRFNGHFQLSYYYAAAGGPSPYFTLYNDLSSNSYAPVGTAAAANLERFRSSAVDKLFNQYAATTSFSQQRAVMSQIQAVMLKSVPVIPVVESASWYQYDTSKLTGWPTVKKPYAIPGPCASPDEEIVLLHLHLK
jgi:peptide/nickel transport system substrate-binding protein